MNTKQVAGQDTKVVNLYPAHNLNAGGARLYGDVFSMKHYKHADIILQSCAGTFGASVQVTVEECTAAAGTNNTGINFKYRKATPASDTLKDPVQVTVGGASNADDHALMPASKGVMLVIGIDADQLSDGYPWVWVKFTDPGAAARISGVAVLSGPRYAQDALPTAIA